MYGCDFYNARQYDQAFPWLKKAADHGEASALYCLGQCYNYGRGTAKDKAKAAQCYQKSLEASSNSVGCSNELGALYFYGDGVEQNYDKAFQLLRWAYDHYPSSNWNAYYLGACYAYGWGTQQDYAMARKFLETIDWNSVNGNYLLGYLYARGLGGPEDIAKGGRTAPEVRKYPGQGGTPQL